DVEGGDREDHQDREHGLRDEAAFFERGAKAIWVVGLACRRAGRGENGGEHLRLIPLVRSEAAPRPKAGAPFKIS
nr:hypothetical protein [Tanacetum cinerariifolium]